MHKGVILLTKAESKEEALDNAREFMDKYQDKVWDWYAIGGRWNNTLAPKDLYDKWIAKTKELLKHDDFGISQQEITSKAKELQEAWEELGLEGKNPYCDHYRLSDDGNEYDVVPLKDCIDTVKEWKKDLKAEQDKIWDEMIEARKDAKENGKYDMSGYYAGIYYDLNYGNFSFESNVFDTTTEEAESIPEDIEEYYAVMVDMHN